MTEGPQSPSASARPLRTVTVDPTPPARRPAAVAMHHETGTARRSWGAFPPPHPQHPGTGYTAPPGRRVAASGYHGNGQRQRDKVAQWWWPGVAPDHDTEKRGGRGGMSGRWWGRHARPQGLPSKRRRRCEPGIGGEPDQRRKATGAGGGGGRLRGGVGACQASGVDGWAGWLRRQGGRAAGREQWRGGLQSPRPAVGVDDGVDELVWVGATTKAGRAMKRQEQLLKWT